MTLPEQWIEQVPENIRPYVMAAAGLGVAAVVGFGVALLLLLILRRAAKRSRNDTLAAFERRWRWPVKWVLPLLFINFTGVAVSLPEAMHEPLLRAVNLLIIAGAASFGIRTVRATREVVELRFDIAARDNLQARKVHTQMRVFEKVLIVVIFIIAGAAMLMTFERIRHLGVSIFASAGIAGIVIGLAAQKTIGTFVAGIQIAITQPIRIDDVVIVEGEWGVIEEITLTYVVVRIWDLRRLVVPITYFIEKPFQNWTRVSADLLGTIYLHVDYRVPVEALRRELQRICENSDLWDGKVCGLIVFEARPQTLELRALISAANSGNAWELRCLVREKLVEFIQREYPQHLPRFRAELEQPGNKTGDSSPERAFQDIAPEGTDPQPGAGGAG